MTIRQRVWPRWQVGLATVSLKEIVGGAGLECEWLENPYRDGWLADPFVLSVADDRIELLVEDFRYADGKGRISKIVVNRRTKRIEARKVLLEGGHYSFPAILRMGEKVYVYPEQSRQGQLELFEYCPETETCKRVATLSEEPLTDAVIYKGGIYATQMPEPNGDRLRRVPISNQVLNIEPASSTAALRKGEEEYVFDECVARNAGDFFEVGGVTYRPAQECNQWYGNAVSIQRYADGKFLEVRRLPDIHTLNSYQGVTVVDRKIFPFRWLFRLLGRTDK